MSNLVEVIKKVALEAVKASNPTSLVIGTVTSTSPLQITVDQKLTLDEDFLILTKNVKNHYVDMSVSHSTVSNGIAGLSHSHSYSGETEENNIDAHTHNITSETGEMASSEAIAGTTLHKHLYSGTTNEAFSNSESATKHSHEYKGKKKIMLHYGLKQGESVLLIKMQGGQKYIVLDRIGDVPVEGEWV